MSPGDSPRVFTVENQTKSIVTFGVERPCTSPDRAAECGGENVVERTIYKDSKMNSVPVGPKSCPVVCPSCKASITTRVDKKATIKTHLMVMLMCSCVFSTLCMCLPYCMDSCRNADHYCPNCGTYLGTYKR